jgi:CHAT domain-containing protein
VIDTKGCPDPETLAALVDRRLGRFDGQRLWRHVTDCPDCFATVSGTMQVCAEGPALAEEPAVVAAAARSRFRPIARRAAPWLAVAAAAVIAFGGYEIFRGGRSAGYGQLVDAVGSRRLVEPRVSGGFAYAPIPSPRRGPAPLDRSDPGSWSIYEAAARIRQEAARDGAGPGARRALGVAHLLLGDTTVAVETLEDTARSAPADAPTLTDLAGAYLVRAEQTGGAEDLVRAIDAARHAIAVDPECIEARFNLALALEKQVSRPIAGTTVDPQTAVGAWEEYLRHDSASPWADEARARLAVLRERGAGRPAPPTHDDVERASRAGDTDALVELVAPGPRIGREVLERRLLPAWAADVSAGRTAAAGTLAAAAVLAQAIERVSGDPLGQEAVRAAAAAGQPGSALVSAQIRYARASDLFEHDSMAAATEEFRAAEPLFERAGSPLRWSAAFYAAIGDYYAGRPTSARQRADDLGSRDAVERYPSLLARIRWVQGWLRGVGGDLSGALDHYREAQRLSQRTGEWDGVASTTFLIAEALDVLGDREAAWRNRGAALGLASGVAPGQRRSIHLDATLAALAQDRPWAALTFVEPLFEPWSAADPGALCQAYLTRARIFGVIDRPEAALADLGSARSALANVGDTGLRRRLEAELAAGRGGTLVGGAPRDAIAPLSQAIDYFQEVDAASRLPELYLDRGRAHQALGAYREAEADFARGVELLERIHASLSDEPHRVSFLDRAWRLFDAIIDLEAGPLASPDQGFAYAERARRAELIAQPDEAGSNPDGRLDAIAGRIEGDRALVYLVLVRDRLLCWVFRDGRSDFRPQQVSVAGVDDLVARVRRATDVQDEAAFVEAATGLYDLLLRPIDDLLPRTGVLFIVPDRRLDDVPYAALIDRRGGRYVLERFAVVIAPTAAYVAWPPRAATPARAEPRVLVVGNPAFDEGRHPNLAPLPGAEAEARQVATLYPHSMLLTGTEATARRLLAELKDADIVHFAGHAIVNDRFPLLSALVMAPEREGDPGDLVTALDLQQAAPAATRLVVLGACRAAGGGTERPGAAFSLARPFLAAGVPAIVGTQWAIGDRPAAAILSSFHQELRRGSSAAWSLRTAQLAALHGTDPETRSPLSWGAFLVNGTAPDKTEHL